MYNIILGLYLADSIGYLGSANLSWGRFFIEGSIIVSIIGIAGIGLSIVYFYLKKLEYTVKPEIEPVTLSL
ncbi:hypothetical protein H7F33_09875 [Pedobacter sp. PAMC26386]|nr:hypothetical protein H7F33_09875 [Pedobacter sp. PAMC26386]